MMVKWDESVINLMNRNHTKMTRQRKEVFRILIENESEHISVHDIHRLSKENNNSISISTIYRTMDILQKMGVVIKHNFGNGIAKYEVFMKENGTHYYLICKKCGKIEEVFGLLGDNLNNRLLEEKRFQVEYQKLEIHGYCKGCMEY